MYYVIAILTAFVLSAFQYLYKRKALFLFILRFLAYAIIFILLLNPKIIYKKKKITKPDLIILADNTLSIAKANQADTVAHYIKILRDYPDLKNKFKPQFYKFGEITQKLDSLQFNETKTDLAQALQKIAFFNQSDKPVPVILLSDGQANLGQDYNRTSLDTSKIDVFPIIFGDTIQPQDIRIDLVNVNPFAFKGNKFPVEVFISADLKHSIKAQLNILENKKIIAQTHFILSPTKRTKKLTVYLPADKVGEHFYHMVLSKLPNENNIFNNTAYFRVNVLSNQHNILLVSDIIHPDLGSLKRSLASQKNIKIDIVTPDKLPKNLEHYESVILYQPSSNFAKVFDIIKKQQKSWLIITGTHTDWTFLNRQTLFFKKQPAHSYENYFARKNSQFSLFELPDLKVDNLPPLKDYYGRVQLNKGTDVAYFSQINGIDSRQALIAFNSQEPQAVILGENIWQWGIEAGIQQQRSYFNKLLYKIFQYLSLQKDYDRLKISYHNTYTQGRPIKIFAQFLNKNLSPDTSLNPVIILKSDIHQYKFPMVLSGEQYVVDISTLQPGTYNFTVLDKGANLKKTGRFTVLPYSLEDINIQTNLSKLSQLAMQTGGAVLNGLTLKKDLYKIMDSHKYKAILSYQTKEGHLIEYKILLFILVFLLASEWLIKKLKGDL